MSWKSFILPEMNVKAEPASTVDIPELAYDRHAALESQTARGPESSRTYPSYDRYVPSRPEHSYRDDYSSSFRGSHWRPSSYHTRTPSPERYDPLRTSEHDHHRPSDYWRSSIEYAEPERRQRETMASRMFEPSDTWKQTHGDNPPRPQIGGNNRIINDRRQDNYFRELSPGRPAPRHDHSPSGDRYRPSYSGYRDGYDSYPSTRRYDSYRPHNDETGIWEPDYSIGSRDVSPPGSATSNHRRESHSLSYPSRPPLNSPEYDHSRFPIRERSFSIASSRGAASPPSVSKQQDALKRGLTEGASPSPKRRRSRSSSRPSEVVHNASLDTANQAPRSYLLPRQLPNEEAKREVQESPSASVRADENSRASNTSNVKGLSVPSSLPTQAAVSEVGGTRTQENNHLATQPLVRDVPDVAPFPSSSEAPYTTTVVKDNAHLSKLNINDMQTLEDSAKQSVSAELRPTSPANNMPATVGGSGTTSARVAPDSSAAAATKDQMGTRADGGMVVDQEPRNVVRRGTKRKNAANTGASSSCTSKPSSLATALRSAAKARFEYDWQTREERVEPILLSNLSISQQTVSASKPLADHMIREATEDGPTQNGMHGFEDVKPSLVARFAERQTVLVEKTQRLREEYLELHKHWKASCARLDRQAKASALEEAAATSGRTTRRSAATMGDAVRSDLEMEQIIASLGNEDLQDPHYLGLRNAAKIPDMISATKGRVDYLYDDTNNLVENPAGLYAPRTGFDDWSEEEKQTILEKFAAFPKQFGIIADYLPNKTTSQCVAYYYIHKKKLIDFRKVVAQYGPRKKRRGGRRTAGTDKRKGNALLADIRQHDAEVSQNPETHEHNGPTTRRKRATQVTNNDAKRPSASRRRVDDTPTPTTTPDPEPRHRARRIKVTARAASAIEHGDEEDDGTDVDQKPAKKGRRTRKPRIATNITPSEEMSSYAILNETRFIDQTELTARRKSATANAQWTPNDKDIFLRLLGQYGDDFKRISASMPHKTTIQVSNYYKSNLVELKLEKVAAGAPKRSPTPELPRDNWKDVHRPYPGSGLMSPVHHDDSSLDGAETEPPCDVEPEPRAPSPASRTQVLDLRNGVILDQRSTWFSAGSTSGSQSRPGPLDPAGHFSGTVDLGIRIYPHILPSHASDANDGIGNGSGNMGPVQPPRYGFAQFVEPPYNPYGNPQDHRSLSYAAPEPPHNPLPLEPRFYNPQNPQGQHMGFNAFTAPSLPEHYHMQ